MTALLLAAALCDPHLWGHVYHPERLVPVETCVTVTGTIVDATNGRRKDGLRHEADGDCHGWARLDAPAAKFLNDGNRRSEGGNLVFEVICAFPVTQEDARAACRGCTSSIIIPAPGSHVAITGTLVRETKHDKWMEIHPVSKIEVLP